MIGSGLRKLAKENGMRMDHGIAYGNLRGYAASLCDGNGVKQLIVTTKFPDLQQKTQWMSSMNAQNLNQEFRVQNWQALDDAIVIIFRDSPGTMKYIGKFLDWFFPLLKDAGATGANICTQCGSALDDGDGWKQVGAAAYHLHGRCAERMMETAAAQLQQSQLEDNGSYASGFVGALLGGVLGSVVWGLVLTLGYLASVVGLLIGFLAERGYHLLHGRSGKGKLVILIVVLILSVILGTFLGECGMVYRALQEEGYTPALSELPGFLSMIIELEPAAMTEILSNLGLGLLFALLGAYYMLKRTHQETSIMKMKDLK